MSVHARLARLHGEAGGVLRWRDAGMGDWTECVSVALHLKGERAREREEDGKKMRKEDIGRKRREEKKEKGRKTDNGVCKAGHIKHIIINIFLIYYRIILLSLFLHCSSLFLSCSSSLPVLAVPSSSRPPRFPSYLARGDTHTTSVHILPRETRGKVQSRVLRPETKNSLGDFTTRLPGQDSAVYVSA